MALDVSAISLSSRLAVPNDGQAMPITNLFDAWGDEADSLADAVSFVCGAGQVWLSDRIDRFEAGRVH